MHSKVKTKAKCHKRARERCNGSRMCERQSNAKESRTAFQTKNKEQRLQTAGSRNGIISSSFEFRTRHVEYKKKAEIKSGAFDAPRRSRVSPLYYSTIPLLSSALFSFHLLLFLSSFHPSWTRVADLQHPVKSEIKANLSTAIRLLMVLVLTFIARTLTREDLRFF